MANQGAAMKASAAPHTCARPPSSFKAGTGVQIRNAPPTHPSARRRRSPERGIGKLLPATRPIPAVSRRRLHAPHPPLRISVSSASYQRFKTGWRSADHPGTRGQCPQPQSALPVRPNFSADFDIRFIRMFGHTGRPKAPIARIPRLYRLTSPQIFPTRALVRLTHALVLPTHALVFPTHALVLPTHALVLPTHALVLPTHALVLPTRAFVLPTHALVLPTRALVLPTRGQIQPTRRQILPTYALVLPTRRQIRPFSGLPRRNPAQNRRFSGHSASFPPFFVAFGTLTRFSPPQARSASLAEPAGM